MRLTKFSAIAIGIFERCLRRTLLRDDSLTNQLRALLDQGAQDQALHDVAPDAEVGAAMAVAVAARLVLVRDEVLGRRPDGPPLAHFWPSRPLFSVRLRLVGGVGSRGVHGCCSIAGRHRATLLLRVLAVTWWSPRQRFVIVKKCSRMTVSRVYSSWFVPIPSRPSS